MAPKTKTGREVKIPVKQRLSTFSDPLEYKIIEENAINLTKVRAFEFLELETFQGERPVGQHHVQFLYDEWSAGRFLWHNVYLAAAKLADKIYRINGQHTCWMRVNIPDSSEPVQAKCMERLYSVESEDQLRNLYACFDRGKPRSMGHISKVLLIGTDAAREIPQSYIGKLVSGFRMFFAEDWKKANMNPNDLTGLIEKSYSTLFNVVGHFFQIHYDSTVAIRRAAVIGAMFATFEKNIQASQLFWEPVLTAIGLTDKQDPRWQLHRFITTHGHTESGIGGEGKIGKEELYRVCIQAWNRWRDGEKVSVLKTTEKRYKAKA